MNVCRMACSVKYPLCSCQRYISTASPFPDRRRIEGSCHINTIVLLVIKAAMCSALWLWLAPVEKDVHQSECGGRGSGGREVDSECSVGHTSTRDSRYESYRNVGRRTTAGECSVKHSTLFIAIRSTLSCR